VAFMVLIVAKFIALKCTLRYKVHMPAEDPPAEPTLTPAQATALIGQDGREFRRRLDWAGRFIFGMWGVAWAISAVAFYFTLPGGPQIWARPVAIVIVSATIGIAVIASIVLGIRANREVRGPSRTAGAWQGLTWLIGYGAVAGMNAGLSAHGLSEDLTALLWSGSSLVIIGTLTLAAGAQHLDRMTFGVGIWLILGGVLSVLVNVPHNYLVLGLAGGSGMVAHAVLAGRAS
jgi:hypothetical protein